MAIKSEGHENKSLSQNTKKYFLMANEPRKDNIMNATVKNEKTATAITSKKFAFTYDHVNKKIVGTDINFQKAGIPGSALEKELLARMEARPAYGFTIIPTEKKPAKQSYKGLNFELMMDYVEFKGNEVQKAEFQAIVDDNASYPTIKSWFLDNFKAGFTVEKATREIAQHKLGERKAKVRATVKAKVVKAAPAVVELPTASNF